jgi:ATP-dependent Clp protease ATP-binding subunit ClpA
VLDKFLQVLEDGRLTDGRGDTVSFAEAVIIFTSNLGAANVQPGAAPGAVREAFLERVRHHFVTVLGRPELLNRIGNNVVPFNFLTDDGPLLEIARSKLRPVNELLNAKYRATGLRFDDEIRALRAVVGQADRAHGGRGVLNELQTCLLDPLAEFLFETEPAELAGRSVRVVQAGGAAQFAFEVSER